MKVLRIITRNIRDSFKGIFRNFSLSLAAISSIIVTLLLVSSSVLISYNVDKMAKIIKSDFTIIAFVDFDYKEAELIETELKKIPNILEYTYEDKKTIAESMKKDSDVFKNIMDKWNDSENPLQDTYLIKVKDTEKINETVNKIKTIKGIELVKYGEGVIENLLSVFKALEKVLIIIVISLVLVTAFLISNTIKLAIFARKKEIEIMKLVGASNININFPFVIEGLILGTLGSIIPIVITIYGYNYLYDYFKGKLFSNFLLLVKPLPFTLFVSLILLGIGILVGMFGSLRAVKKHLKV